MLHIDEELQNIENLVRRVEAANDKGQVHAQTGVTITSASSLPQHDHRHMPHAYSPQVGWKGLNSHSGASSNNSFETVNVPRADLMVELIQQYTELVNSIEAAATKQITVQVTNWNYLRMRPT